ncbi:MAG: D-alanyl-D-alanine carboxypeptidase/D-alanyl-D-alanine-endopeptidase [Brumimicrobium sp.]|nr:D-alanyl-D-alanine carboxypeptidase/D-alanyl-D-alanine-endopeptidase [Brumimicrobium sp.]
MKIIVVCTFYFLSFNFCPGFTQSNKVQLAIDSFVSSEGLENAAISFAAYDITNKTSIAEKNSTMALSPASVVKLFTTAAAFEVLGKDYKPVTRLYIDKNPDSLGVLRGDVFIRGGGDPTLGSRFFYERENQDDFLDEWLKVLKHLGIKKITGRIIADGSAFGYEGAPDGWSWSDLGNYYGSGPSGCVIYDNMTYLHFSTSRELNGLTTLDSMTPKIEGYSLFNSVSTYSSSRDNAYIYGGPYSYDRFAVGNLPRNQSNFEVKASIPDPEMLLAQEFHRRILQAGIEIHNPPTGMRSLLLLGNNKPEYSNQKEILSYKGKSVSDIAYWTNMRSVNLFAEQLLCLIGYEKTTEGTTSKSSDFVNNYWSPRLNKAMFQTDGSGLSRSNGFSADHFIKLLDYMHASGSFEAFKNTLPVAGQSGTLTSLCRGQAADGRMYAKSGTMKRIKSYAGYVESKSGKTIAFALIVNNDDLSGYTLVQKMENVFNAMAQY